MSSSIIRTVIVDDEPAARHGMAVLLSKDQGINIIALCSNGIEAIQEIREKKPDLILLDIQMPGIDGFDVLNNIPRHERPYIVFVTAYDQFAVKAFEYHALDYLLKPYTDERFFEMINRTKLIIKQQKTINQFEKLNHLKDEIVSSRKNLSEVIFQNIEDNSAISQQRLIVREGGKIHLLPLDKLFYIEAYDYYVKIQLETSFILARIPMKNMLLQLPENQFMRIHRSFILNLFKLDKVEKTESGDYQVILTDGRQLKVSNTYKNDLLKKLNN